MESSFNNLHVAILCSPGMGHLIPVLLLANRLAVQHDVKVTVLKVTTAAPELKLLALPLHHLVQTLDLPPVDISHLVDSSARVVTQLCVMVREALPSVRAAVAAMDPRPAALIVDPFCCEAQPIAAEFNMSKYFFATTNAWFTALAIYAPVLDQQFQGEYVDQTEPLQIPGCKPVRPGDVADPLADRKNQQYDDFVKLCRGIPLFDGILVNSWTDIDRKTLQAFAENRILRSVIDIPVHPIGPLTRQIEPEPAKKNTELFRWLDRQPEESVLLVSFGSGGVLSQEQITELAWGLELSKQRFVWVVRRPTGGRVDDAFFNVSNGYDDGTPDYLPQGFLTRTAEVGFLVLAWAPQAEILSHSAVGGFLSHCGWNSTLESVTNGVPMIAWPLYAEQKMNAALLAEEVGVALQTPTATEVVGREAVERMARALMEGEEGKCLREKAKQVKVSGVEALKVGGPSHLSLCHVLAKIAHADVAT